MDTVRVQLQKRWPGREAQISELVAAFGQPGVVAQDVLVHGAAASGKTSVVRDCVRACVRRHAYYSCAQSTKLRHLLSSVLSQLKGIKRKREDDYAGADSDRIDEFMAEISKVVKPGEPSAVLVLDNADLLCKSDMMAWLLRTRDHAGANLAFVAVTGPELGAGVTYGGGHFPLPWMHPVHFPQYTRAQAVEVLMKCMPQSSPQSSLLGDDKTMRSLYLHLVEAVVVQEFSLVTRSVTDMRALAGQLWPLYLKPLMDGKVSIDLPKDRLMGQLFAVVKRDHVTPLLKAYAPGVQPAGIVAAAAAARGGASSSAGGMHAGGAGSMAASKLQLSHAAKLMLVAAFIASHNKPTLDKAVFEAKGGGGRVRGRMANQDSDRQAEAAKEAKLKGPHSFPVSRLLVIFDHVHRASDTTAHAVCSGRAASSAGSRGLQFFRSSFSSASGAAAGSTGIYFTGEDHEDEESLLGLGAASGRREDPDDAFIRRLGRGGVGSSDDDDSDADDDVGKRGGASGRPPRVVPVWRRGRGCRAHQGTHSARSVLAVPCQSADALMQITSLASIKLLTQSGEDALDEPKYTCNVSEEVAAALAADVGLNLTAYLKYT